MDSGLVYFRPLVMILRVLIHDWASGLYLCQEHSDGLVLKSSMLKSCNTRLWLNNLSAMGEV